MTEHERQVRRAAEDEAARVRYEERLRAERRALTEAADALEDVRTGIRTNPDMPEAAGNFITAELFRLQNSVQIRAESLRRRMVDPPGSRKVN